jgi:hypothetical protein
MYQLSVLHLHRLPYEVIADAQRRGADHQVYLALAMLSREAKRQRTANRRAAWTAANPKWARIHNRVDAAAAALSNL